MTSRHRRPMYSSPQWIWTLFLMVNILGFACYWQGLQPLVVLVDSTGSDDGFLYHPNLPTARTAWNRTSETLKTHTITEESLNSTTSLLSSSWCGFRTFPSPTPESKLPWIFDAFATWDGKHANFVAIHRGQINDVFQEADSSLLSNSSQKEDRFIDCLFFHSSMHNTTTTTIPGILVQSDRIHPAGFGHMPINRENEWTFVITCPIPEQYRPLIVQGQEHTNLHVHLQPHRTRNEPIIAATTTSNVFHATPILASTHGLELKLPEHAQSLTQIANIPICHATSPTANSSKINKLSPKQFQFMVHTRIKSQYSYSKKGKPVQDAQDRLHDWIDFHRYQGVDHFVIYDNDPEDHGPLEGQLQPHMDAGLVTRVWNPMEESYRSFRKNSPTYHVQGATGVAALLRFGFASDYFANLDIDEFFLPVKQQQRVVDILRREVPLEPNSTLKKIEWDGMKWHPRVMTYCNGTILPPPSQGIHRNELLKQCLTDQRKSGSKLIFRSDRLSLYHTHNAFLTSDGKRPKLKSLSEHVGYLAHMRRGVKQNQQAMPSGQVMILNDWRKRVNYLDEYLAQTNETNLRIG